MRCKHENADHLRPGEVFEPAYGTLAVLVEQFRCVDCGEWLSLGPSNDDSDAVRVEIRAAEIAAKAGLFRRPQGDIGEDIGWEIAYQDFAHSALVNDAQRAGWLAREIWTHSEPT